MHTNRWWEVELGLGSRVSDSKLRTLAKDWPSLGYEFTFLPPGFYIGRRRGLFALQILESKGKLRNDQKTVQEFRGKPSRTPKVCFLPPIIHFVKPSL